MIFSVLTCCLEEEGKNVTANKDPGHDSDRNEAHVLSADEPNHSSENHVNRSCIENWCQEKEQALHGVGNSRCLIEMRDTASAITDNLDYIPYQYIARMKVNR